MLAAAEVNANNGFLVCRSADRPTHLRLGAWLMAAINGLMPTMFFTRVRL